MNNGVILENEVARAAENAEPENKQSRHASNGRPSGLLAVNSSPHSPRTSSDSKFAGVKESLENGNTPDFPEANQDNTKTQEDSGRRVSARVSATRVDETKHASKVYMLVGVGGSVKDNGSDTTMGKHGRRLMKRNSVNAANHPTDTAAESTVNFDNASNNAKQQQEDSQMSSYREEKQTSTAGQNLELPSNGVSFTVQTLRENDLASGNAREDVEGEVSVQHSYHSQLHSNILPSESNIDPHIDPTTLLENSTDYLADARSPGKADAVISVNLGNGLKTFPGNCQEGNGTFTRVGTHVEAAMDTSVMKNKTVTSGEKSKQADKAHQEQTTVTLPTIHSHGLHSRLDDTISTVHHSELTHPISQDNGSTNVKSTKLGKSNVQPLERPGHFRLRQSTQQGEAKNEILGNKTALKGPQKETDISTPVASARESNPSLPPALLATTSTKDFLQSENGSSPSESNEATDGSRTSVVADGSNALPLSNGTSNDTSSTSQNVDSNDEKMPAQEGTSDARDSSAMESSAIPNADLGAREASEGRTACIKRGSHVVQEVLDSCLISQRVDGDSMDFAGSERRRKGYAKRSLEELEAHVYRRFLRSELHQGLNKHEKREFAPFSLNYNELSIDVLATWATSPTAQASRGDARVDETNNISSKKNNITALSDRPTAASIFRKCLICGLFGHYEIECDNMREENVLELATDTKLHANLRELWREGDTVAVESTTALPDQGHLCCEICSCSRGDDRMLICDGCEKFYHIFCLDPSLKSIPKGEWFCQRCMEYNDGVCSDVEIEAVGGYVIEQRKRHPQGGNSRKQKDTEMTMKWQTAVAMVAADATGSKDVGRSLKAKKLHPHTSGEESTLIDGFVIHARGGSDSPHFLKQLQELNNAEEDTPMGVEDLAFGALVAWFPHPHAVSTEPNIGHILAVDGTKRRALVRRLDDWRQLLADDSNTESTGYLHRILEDPSIHAMTAGATLWYPSDELHVVARAPSSAQLQKFNSEILPSRIRREERRKRKASKGQNGQQRTRLARID